MSLQQAALETGLIYHVVGLRTTGERVMISEHFDLTVAEKVLSLIKSTGNYSEIFVECNGERLPTNRG